MSQEKQRLIEVGPEEMWTPFLEKVNDLLIEEKHTRQEKNEKDQHIRLSEICLTIVTAPRLKNLVD